jgi:hypothetical protein
MQVALICYRTEMMGTLNQNGEAVQIFIGKLIVCRRL